MLNNVEGMGNTHSNKKPMVVIMGATATGKTGLAIELARRYSTEIVSADSMLVYRGMDIGTAKPTVAQRQSILHHMIDIVEPSATYSVADYAKAAHSICLDMAKRRLMPVVVGGTGQYINAMAKGERYTAEQRDDAYRAHLEVLYSDKGAEYLHAMLTELDYKAAKNIHPNNVKRVIRALELRHICRDGMVLPSESRYIDYTLGFVPFVIGLDYRDRQLHKELIHSRVDGMVQQGLLQEVERLQLKNPSKTALQAIGYKELIEFIGGGISLEAAIENIKRATVQYAKRQRTWFARLEPAHWYYVDGYAHYSQLVENVFYDIDKYLAEGELIR